MRLLPIAFFLLMAASLQSAAVEAGDAAPPWVAMDTAGQSIRFPAQSAEKPTIVLFWATWCSYCKAFMPNLARIEQDYSDHGVQVLAINAKERGAGDPRAYMKSAGYPFRVVLNGDAIADAYGIEFIPGLLIVDRNGQVAWRRGWTDLPAGTTVAALWEGQVREALDKLLN